MHHPLYWHGNFASITCSNVKQGKSSVSLHVAQIYITTAPKTAKRTCKKLLTHTGQNCDSQEKNNIYPENPWLETWDFLWNGPFLGGHSVNFQGGTDTLPESSKDVREVCAPQKPTGLEAKLLATYPNLDMIFVWEALWSDVFLGWNWLVGLGLTKCGLTCLKLTRAYVFF